VTRDLRQVFALAGAFKQGDLAVGGTADDRLRDEARRALLATTVGQIRRTPLVEDGVSDALERTRDRRFDGDLDALTIARVRDTLLGPGLVAWAEQHRDALPSDAIAAAAKVMTAAELSSVSRALFNPLGDGEVAIGSPRHFGSRIQPNSPGDDEQEILFSLRGLLRLQFEVHTTTSGEEALRLLQERPGPRASAVPPIHWRTSDSSLAHMSASPHNPTKVEACVGVC